MIKVFFSYSHKDEQLRDELATHLKFLERNDVILTWHDRQIPAGTNWKTQIDENLNTAHIILLLVSADFIASKYCYEVELKRAMERYRSNEARVIPILLRAANWKETPFGELNPLPRNYKPVTSLPNKDEAFAEIASGISEVVEEVREEQKIGDNPGGVDGSRTRPCKVVQAPPLPNHFVDRPEVRQDLKQRLIASSSDQSGTLVISAIQGLGGIGKTILAQALCHDAQVQERFCDGILWATLGQQPDILSLLQGWILALGDYDYKPTTIKLASSHLNSLLYDKAVLLIIDDGWEVKDIEPFRVGSNDCQVIITTRRAYVAQEVDAQLYSLDFMSEEQSLLLLERRLGRDLAEEEIAGAKKLAKEVGYLPIALDLAAARVARGKSWSELNSALTAEIARLEVLDSIYRRRKKETLLEASFNLSLNFLQEEFPETWESFVWLGVLPEDVSVAAPMVATLWQVEVAEAAERLELFWDDALLLSGVPMSIGGKKWPSYRVHDLLHDLAIKWLTKEKSPGLGLTIPQAHNILLERYQTNQDDGKWHKLSDDGYICDHLTWHMEKAESLDEIHQLLREETTDFKRNGWYSTCERFGKTAIFVGDLARAWKLAEAEYETNPSRAIGLQCRYALITSSLNTIAANIPPELISLLVEKKFWAPAQGLAYAQQVRSLPKRVEALRKIAPYFPDIYSEALEAARNISSEYSRAIALRALAPQLPENLLPEALEAARNISSEYYRAIALRALAPQLPEIYSEALEAARNISSEYSRAIALSALAPQLPEIYSEALEAARNIRDESYRARALSALAPQLPENLLSEALEAVRNIRDESYRAPVLSAIIPNVNNMFDSFPYDFWCEVIHSMASFKRKELLEELGKHNNIIMELGSLETIREIADAVHDVGRWFP